VFVLTSSLDRNDLIRFLLEKYRPTPIIVPWSGADFFEVRSKGAGGPFKKTPTSTAIVEAFLASKGVRLAPYRETIQAALSALSACGIKSKTQMEDKKQNRSSSPASVPMCLGTSLPGLIPVRSCPMRKRASVPYSAVAEAATETHISLTTSCKTYGRFFRV